MRYSLLIFMCCITGYAGFAQKLGLKNPPILQYSSAHEQKALEGLMPLSFDSQFRLLYTSSPGADAARLDGHARQVKEFISQLKPKLEKAKTPEKKIKAIHKEVHGTYLKKYVMENHFADIFSRGEYNCVSATALYALILDELSIPYAIKEMPTHVFLVAYPSSASIALESTDPQVGYTVFNAKFKTEYINQLRKMKLVSESEFQEKGTDGLFDELYFNDQDISLKELIALQYYNDGLYLIDKSSYDKSLRQFEKAYTLYPSDRGGYLIFNTLLLAKEQKTYADTVYIDYVIKLTNIKGFDDHREHVKNEFLLITQDQLSNKGQIASYDKMYNKFVAGVTDSVLLKDVSYIYYFEKGRTAFNTGQFNEALRCTEKAYSLMPDATNSIGLMLTCLNQRLAIISSVDEKTEFLETYVKKYPTLENNNVVYSNLLQLYLAQFGQAYELNQEKKGIQYRQNFEKAYQLRKEGTERYLLDPAVLGRAYSVAAVYYFRKGQTAQARQIINKGLEYDPNNFELLQRKQMIR